MKKFKISIIVVLLGSAIWSVIWLNHPIRLVVKNESDQSITDVITTIGEKSFDFSTLEPGQQKEKWFFHTGKTSLIYTQGTFASGGGLGVGCQVSSRRIYFDRAYFEFNKESVKGEWNR
jgi:hypothetical protein